MSWYDAEIHCKKEGGHLASIRSKEAMDFIHELARKDRNHNMKYFWIGANDLMNEFQFVWSDGSNFNYSNWRPTRPKETTQYNCVSFLRYDGGSEKADGRWNDQACHVPRFSFCQISEEISKPETIKEPQQGMVYPMKTIGTSDSAEVGQG